MEHTPRSHEISSIQGRFARRGTRDARPKIRRDIQSPDAEVMVQKRESCNGWQAPSTEARRRQLFEGVDGRTLRGGQPCL